MLLLLCGEILINRNDMERAKYNIVNLVRNAINFSRFVEVRCLIETDKEFNFVETKNYNENCKKSGVRFLSAEFVIRVVHVAGGITF